MFMKTLNGQKNWHLKKKVLQEARFCPLYFVLYTDVQNKSTKSVLCSF
jgi:hypothetical protein